MTQNKSKLIFFSFILSVCSTTLYAQVPCSNRLIANVDFSYTGGAAPARWNISETNATSQGLTFDDVAYSYVSTGDFSNVRMNNIGTNNNTRQYAIVSNPYTLNSTQYANIPATDGMLVINPLQGNADNYFSFSIGGLIPSTNVYKVEIKVYNVLALNCSTGYCQGGGTTNSTNVGDILRVLGTFNASNPGDKSAAQNTNWTGSNGSGTWNVQGTDPIYDMLRPTTAGTYAIMTANVTLQPGNTSFTLNFSKQNTADPIVLGIDYIKVYGCQEERIVTSTGTVDGGKVCESTPITLTAQGLGSIGSTYTWKEYRTILSN